MRLPLGVAAATPNGNIIVILSKGIYQPIPFDRLIIAYICTLVKDSVQDNGTQHICKTDTFRYVRAT